MLERPRTSCRSDLHEASALAYMGIRPSRENEWGPHFFPELLPLSHVIDIAAVDVLVHFLLQLVPSFGYRSCVTLRTLSCFRGELGLSPPHFLD